MKMQGKQAIKYAFKQIYSVDALLACSGVSGGALAALNFDSNAFFPRVLANRLLPLPAL